MSDSVGAAEKEASGGHRQHEKGWAWNESIPRIEKYPQDYQ